VTRTDRLASLLDDCRDRPGLFSAAILGDAPFDPDRPRNGPFWHRQRDASRLVTRYHTTILPWGNSLGKSWWLARVVLWWLCTRPGSLVITTAPTYQQLDSVLWKNIRQAHGWSKIPLGGDLRRKPLALDFGDGWQAIGINTSKVERLSGQHNPDLLFVGDEASGLHPEVFEAADSLVPAKVILIGNPIRAEGRFRELYDLSLAQDRDPSIPDHERTASLRVASTESPDIDLDRSARGLAAGSWLRRMYRQYGQNSLWVKTHIRAEFPDASTEGVFPARWLDRASSTPRPAATRSEACMAIDLGEGKARDKTVFVVRDHWGVLDVVASNTLDLAAAALTAAALMHKWVIPQTRISYDKLGVGQDFERHLARHGITNAIGYHGSGSGGKDFYNLRSKAAWTLRQRLDPDRMIEGEPRRHSMTGQVIGPGVMAPQEPFSIPPFAGWEMLRKELLAYKYELLGRKIKLETKDDLCDRLGHSPDYADALIQSMAFFD
jgi:phage terminase large subunit